MNAGSPAMTLPASGTTSSSGEEALREGISFPKSETDLNAKASLLATAVSRGDETAFRELYEQYQARLFRFALVLTQGDETLAGEIVQSVFVTAAAKLRRIESEKHLWNWLARIARQHFAKVRRQSHRDPATVTLDTWSDKADTAAIESHLEENLNRALRTLAPEDRELIEAFYFDGLSQKELAARLGSTPKAISSRLERARQRLRTALKQNLAHEL